MSHALVIGNGESRSQINIESYENYITIGCNAIHRDVCVDHLICCDRRMAEEATNNSATVNTIIYVRPHWFHYFRKIKKNKNVKLLPELPYSGEGKKDDPEHWGSGCYAVLLAAALDCDNIELIGFDLYSSDNKVNNIYKDTINYSKSDAHSVDPSYWIYQISKVFSHYQHINFIVKNKSNWAMPIEWQKKNVTCIAL